MIHIRFKQYLGIKMLSQKEIARLSGLTENQVSRFCKDGNMTVDNLQKLLQVCNDISLEFLFFGDGDVLKKMSNSTSTESDSKNMDNKDLQFVPRDTARSMCWALSERDDTIGSRDNALTKRDATISARDETISELNKALIALTAKLSGIE